MAAAVCCLVGCSGSGPGGALNEGERRFADAQRQSCVADRDRDMRARAVPVELPAGRPFEMQSVEVENAGRADVDGVWIYTNDAANLYSPSTAMAGVPTGDHEAAIERLLALRKACFLHHVPVTQWGYPHHPVALFGALGYGICDDVAAAAAVLGRAAGVGVRTFSIREDRFEGRPLSRAFEHVICLVRVEDRWIPLDLDHGVVWRRGDGRLASAEDLAADPALAGRGGYQWRHEGHDPGRIIAGALARARLRELASPRLREPRMHRSRLVLPVGSRFTWLWTPLCEPFSDSGPAPVSPRPAAYSNGVFEWQLPPQSSHMLHTSGCRLAAVLGPYPMLEGNVRAAGRDVLCMDRFVEHPQSVPRTYVWQRVDACESGFDLTPLFRGRGQPRRNITLGVLLRLPRQGAASVRIVVQSSKLAQPTLRPGRNVVHVYCPSAFARAAFTTRIAERDAGFDVVLRSSWLRVTFACRRGPPAARR